MTKSEALFERAQTRIPGGVNSPVRAFKAVGGTPRFMERSDGAYIFDADGNKYIGAVPFDAFFDQPHEIARDQRSLDGTAVASTTGAESTGGYTSVTSRTCAGRVRVRGACSVAGRAHADCWGV